MTNTMAALEYRRALTQQASAVGLVIALHDTLIGDLRRAAQAMEKKDIEARCDQLIHGFQILTQLEAMLDMRNGGPAASNILRFYRYSRGEMLAAQFKLDPAILYRLMKTVLEVREAWQQLEDRGMTVKTSIDASYASSHTSSATSTPSESHVAFSCSC